MKTSLKINLPLVELDFLADSWFERFPVAPVSVTIVNHHTNNEINGMLSYPRRIIINDTKIIFFFF